MRISDCGSDVCSSDLEILDFHAVTSGGQWAIAELELASIKERQKRANPWELKVCPGTLRPLSEIPDDWQVSVTGTESARRIATLARDEKIGRASGRENVCQYVLIWVVD